MATILSFPASKKAAIRRRLRRVKLQNGGVYYVAVDEPQDIPISALLSPGLYTPVSQEEAEAAGHVLT